MRHVARTHRVDLDWLFERLKDDPGIGLRYVNTKDQIADLFTKGSFSSQTWNTLCKLAQLAPAPGEHALKPMQKGKDNVTPSEKSFSDTDKHVLSQVILEENQEVRGANVVI